MQLDPKTTKKRLMLTAALLTCGTFLAAAYLSQAANAAPRRSVVYYRIVPDSRNHPPHEVSNTEYGLYRQFLLPDGTVTGPISPDANGG
jgi:hypothetical protein